MEIINYVQKSEKRSPVRFFNNNSSTSGSYRLKNRKKSAEKSVYIFSTKQFTFRRLFAGIGRGVSGCGSFILQKKKLILIVLSIIVTTLLFTDLAFRLYSRFLNHTGPVSFSENDKNDYDSLDKFMSVFALETSPSVDGDGNLMDSSSISTGGIFTQPVSFQNYRVKSGDTISGISKKFGLSNISTLISVNDISNVRQLAAGQKLRIPSMDGIVYTVKKGDTIDSVVSKYNIRLESLLDVNELSTDRLVAGQILFIPGAALDRTTLKNAMGELFILPISAAFTWSSPYGWRTDPIAKVKSFHTGVDLACPQGTPILASQSGKVSTVGFNRVYGNYIILDHGNGYQTLYAHMYKTIAKKGTWVSQGTRIGLVGTTGYSTGPHLHFMVYKNGGRIDPMTVLRK